MELIFEIIRGVALYVMPIAAFLLSILAYLKSKECVQVKLELDDVQKRLNEYDLKLKQYELEKIEKERDKQKGANIEARIVKISQGKYKIKIWNAGNDKAYDVDYSIPPEYHITMIKLVTPFECLDIGKSFEESVIISMGSQRKFRIITSWKDEKGERFSNEILGSI